MFFVTGAYNRKVIGKGYETLVQANYPEVNFGTVKNLEVNKILNSNIIE